MKENATLPHIVDNRNDCKDNASLAFVLAVGIAVYVLILTGLTMPAWTSAAISSVGERVLVWCEINQDHAVRALTMPELSLLATGGSLAEIQASKGLRLLDGKGVAPVAPPFQFSVLLGAPLPINLADGPTLKLLPEIGGGRAAQIIRDRQQHGAFRGLEDFAAVRGIGQGRARRIGAWLDFRSPRHGNE